MIVLRDDRYFTYAGVPITLDVLANDTLPANYTLTGSAYISNKLVNLGDAFELTTDRYGRDLVTYSVDGGANTASAHVVTLDGTPGLGGFYFGEETQDEDGGIYTLDVDAMIDPQGTSNYVITSLSSHSALGLSYTAEVNNGILTMDLDQFSNLGDGWSDSLTMTIGTSNGAQTASSSVNFYVTGKFNAVTTINTAQANGDMVGTSGPDVITSIANQDNAMLGGNGADIFKFNSEFKDGNADRNTIVDYQVGRDSIEFEENTQIEFMFEIDDGVMFILDGGQDVLFIHGDGVDTRSLSMDGEIYRSFETAGSGDGAYGGAMSPAAFDRWLYESGELQTAFNNSVGYGFGGTYGLNIDFDTTYA